MLSFLLFAIEQKYEFSSKSQLWPLHLVLFHVVCDTAKVRVFKQITTTISATFSEERCLRYCKSTSFQANHNTRWKTLLGLAVVCDTAKVRVFKQITTCHDNSFTCSMLFAILQKYEFSSKSQPNDSDWQYIQSCLRYCKSTSFQANND